MDTDDMDPVVSAEALSALERLKQRSCLTRPAESGSFTASESNASPAQVRKRAVPQQLLSGRRAKYASKYRLADKMSAYSERGDAAGSSVSSFSQYEAMNSRVSQTSELNAKQCEEKNREMTEEEKRLAEQTSAVAVQFVTPAKVPRGLFGRLRGLTETCVKPVINAEGNREAQQAEPQGFAIRAMEEEAWHCDHSHEPGRAQGISGANEIALRIQAHDGSRAGEVRVPRCFAIIQRSRKLRHDQRRLNAIVQGCAVDS
eukprot:1194329-Prorocentrum_minimum.AAC.6